MRNSIKMVLMLCCLTLLPGLAFAKPLTVACAANFTAAMKELAAQYEKETGTEVRCTFGSTGMLYGQIENGAPFDLFFAADQKRPALLHKAGLAAEPAPYAKGRSVLWTANTELQGDSWKDVVASAEVKRIGIANPKTAPYGLAAQDAFTACGLDDAVAPKLVFGKSVGVSFQYAFSEAADASFVALSQAISGKGLSGKYWPMPEAAQVKQDACVLLSGQVQAAESFLEWMRSEQVAKVLKKYGYE